MLFPLSASFSFSRPFRSINEFWSAFCGSTAAQTNLTQKSMLCFLAVPHSYMCQPNQIRFQQIRTKIGFSALHRQVTAVCWGRGGGWGRGSRHIIRFDSSICQIVAVARAREYCRAASRKVPLAIVAGWLSVLSVWQWVQEGKTKS